LKRSGRSFIFPRAAMNLDQITTAHLPEITEPVRDVRPMPIRGWILLDPDVSHLDHTLSLCAEYDINHLQISHGIVHTAADLTTEVWRADRVNRITRLALDRKIETFVWTHEFDRIPEEHLAEDGRVDMRRAELWSSLEERYAQIFASAEFDGLVLTFQETQASVYHDRSVISDEPQPARVTRLIQFMSDVCTRHGKKLIVRTFCYNSEEMNWILDGLKETDPGIGVMVKCQPSDWNPYYPHNELVRHFAASGRGFLVEMDLGEEYHGQNALPYFCPDYVRYRLNHVINCATHLPEDKRWGCAARIERYAARALGSLNEANLRVFSAILSDPACDGRAVAREALREQFGDWAQRVEELLNPTFDLINAVVYPVPGTWGYLMHTAVADLFYVHDSLVAWTQVDEWVDEEAVRGLAVKVVTGDERTLAVIEQRLTEAEDALEKLLAGEKKLAGMLPVELRVIFAPQVRRLEAFARVNIAHHRVVFALYAWRRSGEVRDRRHAVELLDQFRRAVDDHGGVLFNMMTEGVFLNRRGTELFMAQCERALETGFDATLAEKGNIGDFVTRYGHGTAVMPG
jgi:hypothetical protein